MRLTFLGTAAAEGYPGIFCDCPNCQEARALGGRSLRLRSALLVNDDLLIDYGPDLLAAALRFNLNFARVTTGLVTHVHPDHFHPANFEMRLPGFTSGLDIPTLHLFGPREVEEILRGITPDTAAMRVAARTVSAFDCWQHGPYTFTAYRAYHAVNRMDALFYAIEDGQRAFLYATDTGPFPAVTWRALEGKSFDAIILEETLGDGAWDQHLGYQDFLAHAERMRSQGMLRPGGRLIAHHFSHTANPTHEKLQAFFAPHDVEVAYDGMVVEL